MSIATLWDSIWVGRRAPPTAIRLPSAQVEGGDGTDVRLEPDRDYFQVVVNQLYLAASRKWFTAIDPMVFALSEFTYGTTQCSLPFLVGPGMLKGPLAASGTKEPAGMIYRNTRVAGVHPYRGGKVSLAIVLCQVPVDQMASRLLQVVEGVTQAIDFTTALGPYLKIGSVVLNGFNSIMGLDGVKALLGWRADFDRDGNSRFAPGYFVLLDEPDVDPATLWVRGGQLFRGSSLASAQPLRDSDFVLFSIVRPPDGIRSDLRELAFWPAWERVQRDANVAKPDAWDTAKVNMASLRLDLLQSPDLTETQADLLSDQFIDKMQAMHKQAVKLGNLGNDAEEDALASQRRKALSVLNL